MDPAQTIIEPIITEKAILVKTEGRYVFRVHPKATKIDIKRAVEKLFKVSVKDVNTVTTSYKKAYVTLKKDQKIEELEV